MPMTINMMMIMLWEAIQIIIITLMIVFIIMVYYKIGMSMSEIINGLFVIWNVMETVFFIL